MEIAIRGGLFIVNSAEVKITKLMETVDWSINQLNKVDEELSEYFSHQHNAFKVKNW